MKPKTKSLVIVLLLCLLHCELFGQGKIEGSEWNKILEKGEGQITFFWFETYPFVFMDEGSYEGIEYELANSFTQFVEKKYQIKLSTNWVSASRFEDLIDQIRQTSGGVFGMSGLSITEDRKETLQFTPPYMPDISVIVSSPDVPVAESISQFSDIFNGLKVLYLPGSTFELKLAEIRKENDISFNYEKVETTAVVMEKLENIKGAFGYIDLPSFLIAFNEGTTVRRQYFYPLKLSGLGFAYPKDSDWAEPVEAYFNSDQFRSDKQRIINKYLGEEISQLINRVARSADLGPEEEIIILSKERELQYQELLNNAIQQQKDQQIRDLMILAIIIVVSIAILFYALYRVKMSANQELAAKQAEIELKNTQLIDLNDEKDQLIGVLAHDLRSPIGRMVGVAQVLKPDLPTEKVEMVELIEKDADKLNTLITKILDIEAIENHDHNLNIQDVNAVETLNELVSELDGSAKAKGIKLETSFAKPEVLLKADKVYLSQSIENLMSNAIKFSGHNTTIKVEIDEDKVIHIHDQGPGFTDEDKEKVFKKFQHLSAKPTGGESSTGIGLTTVKLFIELMGGKVWFDSEVGVGTVFHIKLPSA